MWDDATATRENPMDAAASSRRVALLVAVASAGLVAAFTRAEVSANPGSRLATIDALVHDGGFAIDASVFRDTIDKVFAGGHYYSSKPPLLSVLGAGVYWLVHRATGWSLRGEGRALAIVTVTLVLMLGAHLLLLAYGFRLLALWDARPRVLLPAYAGLALASLAFGYATSINNHTPAAALSLAAFYHAVRARRSPDAPARHLVLAGVFAGLAPTLDLAAVFVSAGVGLYLLAAGARETLLRFVPAAALPLLVHFSLTYVVSGGLLPIYLRPELYHYPGSYWDAPSGMDALAEPRGVYFLHMLLGHHGLFSMTPLFVFALITLARTLGRREGPVAEARVVAGVLVALVAFYGLTTRNYGGQCVGFRWLIVVMPLLFVFVAEWLRPARGRLALAAFALAFGVAQLNAADALRGPWRTSVWHARLQEWGRG